MNIEYVPLIQIQRDLHALPRGRQRFLKYLATIANKDGSSLDLPSLVIMNPMGKDHITRLLDTLLEMDADGIAACTVAEVEAELPDPPGHFKAALVVADDLLGGWTNRYASEYSLRFAARAPGAELPRWLKCHWINAVLWSSETPSTQSVRNAVRMAVHRTAYLQEHGPPATLREMLTQEGHVMAMAGCHEPVLDPDDLAYTRDVLAPFLDASDMRTAIECLFGDEAGRTLGFTPRGLSLWAGLALALHDAHCHASPDFTAS